MPKNNANFHLMLNHHPKIFKQLQLTRNKAQNWVNDRWIELNLNALIEIMLIFWFNQCTGFQTWLTLSNEEDLNIKKSRFLRFNPILF